MFRIELTAQTSEELKTKVLDMAALMGSTSTAALAAASKPAGKAASAGQGTTVDLKTSTGDGTLSEAEAAKIAAGTATVSAPTAAQKKAAAAKLDADKKAAEEAAAIDTGLETEAEVDPLAEEEVAPEPESFTIADVRKFLVEMRDARPDKPSLTADLIKEMGGVKLGDVPETKFGALITRAKEELAKAKK